MEIFKGEYLPIIKMHLWVGHRVYAFPLYSSSSVYCKYFLSHQQNAELTDKLAASETEVAELKNQVEDLEYHLNSATQRVDKLDRHLADTMQKLKTYQEGEIKVQGGGEGVSKNKVS